MTLQTASFSGAVPTTSKAWQKQSSEGKGLTIGGTRTACLPDDLLRSAPPRTAMPAKMTMEEEAGDARVPAVDPVDSEDEEGENEDEVNRASVIRQYFH
ncbi:hypothetical protein NDU88_002870 [Pleurodeles waltl]|uniref:Uncharacterized protein n=1 Tax=Pleurodeles waltl TaxID=8319 RepID=A0AAV7W337_PLEWA|nr:hypothetical protein NDU88_002870 [Pleurodeles waltl]